MMYYIFIDMKVKLINNLYNLVMCILCLITIILKKYNYCEWVFCQYLLLISISKNYRT